MCQGALVIRGTNRSAVCWLCETCAAWLTAVEDKHRQPSLCAAATRTKQAASCLVEAKIQGDAVIYVHGD